MTKRYIIMLDRSAEFAEFAVFDTQKRRILSNSIEESDAVYIAHLLNEEHELRAKAAAEAAEQCKPRPGQYLGGGNYAPD